MEENRQGERRADSVFQKFEEFNNLEKVKYDVDKKCIV